MENINETRKGFDHLGEFYPKEASVKVERASVSEVNCYWFTPENAHPNKIIIYLHGGAFVLGSIRSHGSMVSHFSNRLRSKILFVDYALAPENPYPAANIDVLNVYKELLNNYPDSKIDFIGDSAGGGLIVAAIGAILNENLPMPHAAILISPWVSLTCDNPSYQENQSLDHILSEDLLKGAAAKYIGETSIETADPARVKLTRFPPVLIAVGTNEILLDDSRNLHQSVKEVESNATLTIYGNQHHVWPLADINSDASQQLMGQMSEFLQN